MRNIIALAIILLLSENMLAQFQGSVYEARNNAQVLHYGQSLNAAWCGGLNSIQPVEVDLNNDGKLDLVQFDQANYIIKTFLNIGNAGETKYAYAPNFEKNFPPLVSYLILKDYNCDGIADLFHRSDTGVQAYKGSYDNNELKFTYYKSIYYPAVPLPINAYVQLGDIPAILDMDGDGDLDMLSFDVWGVYLNYYKNMRVENNLPCDSIAFTFHERCWGKFYQSWDRTAITNITCKGGDINETQNKQTRHAGNCILAIDMEGDGDFDILDGVFVNKDIQLLYNDAANLGGNSFVSAQDTTYNQNSQIVNMPNWPVPSSLDIDHDGDQDLIFSAHADNLSSANYDVAQFYKNTGTNASPNFVYQHDSLFTRDMIDVGAYSYPTFFDYDKDGKKDLFIGTEGYLNNVTQLLETKLAFYKNISTAQQIAFELVTKDFLNLSIKNHKGLFPTFGDVTGDGIDDLVIGGTEGKIAVYKNNVASNTLQPNFTFLTDSLANVKVDQYSFPFVYDWDKDGKSDLLVGNLGGTLEYFKDSSLIGGTKAFKLMTSNLGGVLAGKPNQSFTYCAPFVGKMDYTNKEYLLIGNSNGNLQRYDSLSKLIFNQIDTNYSFIKTPNRSVPAVADLNGDGMYEMLIGNKLGGLSFYQQVKNGPEYTTEAVLNNQSVILFPNPTHDFLNIILPPSINKSEVEITIFDLTGRLLVKSQLKTNTNNQLQISSLPKGIYFLQLNHQQQRVTKQFVKE